MDPKTMISVAALGIAIIGEGGLLSWTMDNEHRITTVEAMSDHQAKAIEKLEEKYDERSQQILDILIELKSRRYERNPNDGWSSRDDSHLSMR